MPARAGVPRRAAARWRNSAVPRRAAARRRIGADSAFLLALRFAFSIGEVDRLLSCRRARRAPGPAGGLECDPASLSGRGSVTVIVHRLAGPDAPSSHEPSP